MLSPLKNSPFAWNSLVLFSGSMLTNILNYIFHLAVGRLVSPAAYGEIESLISLMNIVSVPSLALIMLSTKVSAANKADGDLSGSRQVFTRLTSAVTVYGTALFILFLVISPWLAKYLKISSPIFLVMVWVAMLLSLFHAINTGLLNGWQKFRQSSLSVALGTAIKLILAIALILLGYQVAGALAGFLAAGVVIYFISLYFLKFIFHKIDAGQKPISILAGAPLRRMLAIFFVGNLAINILGNADMVLAKVNLSSELAGQYGALCVVGNIIFFATGIISTVIFSMSAENFHKNISSKKIFFQAAALIFVLGAAATSIYFLFPKFVLGMLFGEKYFSVAAYLGWYAIAISIFSLNNLITQFCLSRNFKVLAYINLTISLFMVGVILLYGKSIPAIIAIVISMQLLALFVGIVFMYINRFNKQISAA